MSSRAGNDAAEAVRLLTDALDVRVTRTAILEAVGNDPSMAAIANALDAWGVATMSVRIGPDDLAEAPYPCLAFLKDGGVVVLTGIADAKVTVVDPRKGKEQRALADFAASWGGLALLVARHEHSGELNYGRNRKLEQLTQARKWVLLAVLVLFFLVGTANVLYTHWDLARWWAALLLLKGAGAVIALHLVRGQFSQVGGFLAKLCPAGEKVNCDGVLKSPAANLFGWLPLSEAGAFYFVGGAVSLLLGAMSSSLRDTLWLLSAVNLLTLPFSLFSVYYQWRVVRQWCTYCLITVGLFWLEFALMHRVLLEPVDGIPVSGLGVLVAGFLLPLAAWVGFRPFLLRSLQVNMLRGSLATLKKDARIVRLVLEDSPLVEVGEMDHDILLGSADAPVVVAGVLSPFCPHCGEAFRHLVQLQASYPGLMRVVFRFSVSKDVSDKSNVVARSLLGVSIAAGGEAALARMHAWYALSDQARLGYLGMVPGWPGADVSTMRQAAELLLRHQMWAYGIFIKGTPATVYDGRLLPLSLELRDLKVLLDARENESSSPMTKGN